jgi:hypothetical protein
LSWQAREVALEWFALVEAGNIEQAFDRTISSIERPPPPSPLDPAASSGEPAPPPVEQFRVHPVVHFLAEHAHDRPVRYIRDLIFEPGAGGEARIQQEFSVGDDKETATTVALIMQRTRANTVSPSRWLVADYQSDDLPPDEHADAAAHVHSH